jgi:hypothetical protein
MVGKATLFVVAGFSLIFLVVEYNMGNVSTRAVSNFVDYYVENYTHELAVSGANLAANEMFLDQTWTAGYKNLNYKGGKLSVKVEILDAFTNTRKITSVAEYQTVKQTVEITLIPSKFSKFAYYSASEGSNIYWISKDTVWGPFHTQDYLKVSGNPVFYGKTSTLKGLQKSNIGDKPQFLGGFESGLDISIPLNVTNAVETEANKGGFKITNKDTVYLAFVSDSIKIKYSFKGKATSYSAKSLAPNGVIFIKDPLAVRVQGTVKGQYTVAVSGPQNKGNIYIDDDIKYSSNPVTNPNSTDVLGLVSKNNVIITQNPANNKDVIIQASIFCEKGGFTAQNYDTRPVSGTISLLGGITQSIRGAVGTFKGTTIKTGFSKSYTYDERFLVAYPPAFPGTGGFEIVSWYE